MKSNSQSNHIIKKLAPLIPTDAYDTYWKFATERQNIFFRRLEGLNMSLTTDPVLSEYKFTNAYRICDRVSQYLVKEIIYSNQTFTDEDTILRIILFKLFNKIETWQMLETEFGEIAVDSFDHQRFSSFLDRKMNKGNVLYSNAYMMASGCREFKVTRKHQAHFQLLNKMLKEELPKKVTGCNSMASGYALLLSYPMIGKFLAYQYITDINYSEVVEFSENEFTVPGPGARDGIRKCFHNLAGLSEADIIKLMADRQELEFERLGLSFKFLGSRRLQYIDIQNIFCETDKYCRVVHPEIAGISGRTKIKQRYRPNSKPIELFFPPKWKVNLGRK